MKKDKRQVTFAKKKSEIDINEKKAPAQKQRELQKDESDMRAGGGRQDHSTDEDRR